MAAGSWCLPTMVDESFYVVQLRLNFDEHVNFLQTTICRMLLGAFAYIIQGHSAKVASRPFQAMRGRLPVSLTILVSALLKYGDKPGCLVKKQAEQRLFLFGVTFAKATQLFHVNRLLGTGCTAGGIRG